MAGRVRWSRPGSGLGRQSGGGRDVPREGLRQGCESGSSAPALLMAEPWGQWLHRSDVVSTIQHSTLPTLTPVTHNAVGHRLPQGQDHKGIYSCRGALRPQTLLLASQGGPRWRNGYAAVKLLHAGPRPSNTTTWIHPGPPHQGKRST